METAAKTSVTIEATVNASIEKVWRFWTLPEHITKWNSASDDWHTPSAENDLRNGGRFSSRMEARDGNFGFDFGGVYDEVKTYGLIAYTLDDDRKVKVIFRPTEPALKSSKHLKWKQRIQLIYRRVAGRQFPTTLKSIRKETER